MMILAQRGLNLNLVLEVGNFGVGAFRLIRYGPGAGSAIIGEQKTPPYTDIASFNVEVPAAGSLKRSIGYGVEVLGMLQNSSAKMPLSLTGVQDDRILPLLGPDNHVVNGPTPPFSSHNIALLTPGIKKHTTFLVHFQ